MERGKLFNTIQLFTKQIEEESENYIHYYKRCLAYTRTRQFEEATKDAEKLISLNPLLAEGYYRKGNVHLYNDSWDEAILCFEKGLQIEPEHAKMKHHLSYIEYSRKWNNQTENALHKLKKDSRTKGYFDKPVDRFKAPYEHLIIDLFSPTHVGIDFFVQPFIRDAWNVLYGSGESNPKNVIHFQGNAINCFSRQEYEKGIELCENVVQIGRQNNEDWEHSERALRLIGDAYKKMGDQEKHKEYHQKAALENKFKPIVHFT